MKIRIKPRDGGFLKIDPNCTFQVTNWSNCTFQVLYWPLLMESGVKISFILGSRISIQWPKVSGSFSSLLFDSFGPGVKIRTNPRDGGFEMYISSLKQAGFAGSKVKIIFKLRGTK